MAPFLQLRATTAALVAALATAAPAPAGDCCSLLVQISEVRTGSPAPEPQNNEFFELVGPPGTPLDCLFYVVLGPDGVVEEIIDLSGASIPPDAHFLAGQVDPLPFSGASPDLLTPLNFIDGGNRTHLLVCSCAGLPGIDEGSDLDQDDDGSLDTPPWDCVLDCIGLVENPTMPVYCPISRGPTPLGTAPVHVYRCQPLRYWLIGPASLPGGFDTPGAANAPCPPGSTSATAFGLDHTALGGAVMLQAPGGELLVSNIGSSGKDGVVIDPGRADYLCVEFGTFSFEDLLDGSLHLTAEGYINNAPLTEIQHIAFEGVAEGVRLYPAYPPALTDQVDVTLYSGDALVHEALGITFDPFEIIILGPFPDGPVVDVAPKPGEDLPLPDIGTTLTLAAPTMISVDNVAVTADKIVFEPTDPFEYDAYGRIQLTAANVEQIGISGERIGRYGNRHRALNTATMTGLCDPDPQQCDNEILEIGNIGTTGFDGVAIEAPYYITQPEGMIIGLIIYTEPDVAPNGASVEYESALRSATDGALIPFSSSRITDPADGTLEVEFTWEPCEGCPDATIIYMNGEKTVHEETVPGTSYQTILMGNAEILTISDLFTHETYTTEDPVSGEEVCVEVVCLRVPFLFPEPGVADRIILYRACGEDTNIEFDALDTELFAFAEPVPGAAGGEPWTVRILDEEPILSCPADLDGDGTVGTTDFLALLAAWGPNPGHAADLDGDGTVGTTDFLALLAAWGPCS